MRLRQALLDRCDAELRISAACNQCAHFVAYLETRVLDVTAFDRSRYFQPRQVGGAGRGRIGAFALQDVGPIHSGGVHFDQYLASAGLRHRPFGQAQHFRTAGLRDLDCPHQRCAHCLPPRCFHRNVYSIAVISARCSLFDAAPWPPSIFS